MAGVSTAIETGSASRLVIYQSNRLETLAEELSEVLMAPCGSPLAPEIVVVSSRGMQRWLSLEIARLTGVCANVSFPFMRAFVLDMISRALGGRTPHPFFTRDVMTLGIMEVLPGLAARPGLNTLGEYLEHDPEGLKLFQLSGVLANLFDQYLVYRPDMVLGWEKGLHAGPGDAEAWQRDLWIRISRLAPGPHLAGLCREFLDALNLGEVQGLPGRVSVFCVHSWPPSFLGVLEALSRRIEVNMFCLNPCRQYWGDIRSARRIARIASRGKEPDFDSLHLEVGNELLASFGDMNREFLDMVLDLEAEQVDRFEDVEQNTMLGRIHKDILDLRGPGGEGPVEVPPGDLSVQFHVCHSAMREVEVLRDVLLDLFERIPDLRPEEVLVMAPDIEEYVPHIRAVFHKDREGAHHLPYSISDRSFRTSSVLADALLRILGLPQGRFEASTVMDLLEMEPVRRRFGIGEQEIPVVRGWVRSSAIRWGMDEHHRLWLGLPPFEENTWEFGLRRLLLGYAMKGDEGPFLKVAPLGGLDPSHAQLLGKFCEFVERLRSYVSRLWTPRRLWEWSELLLGLLDDLFSAGEERSDELVHLKGIVAGIGRASVTASYTGEVGAAVVARAVKGGMDSPAEGSGFLERGMTFCSMLPMRSVPFRVICLLGMNHDAFPRRRGASGLDLMSAQRRKGDRDLRTDDLSLFLETIVSARRALSISYVGKGIRDNAPKPPSVVVSALTDYIDKAFTRPDGVKASQGVTFQHHLQAFNPAYFTSRDPLHSFSEDNALAARALLSPKGPWEPAPESTAAPAGDDGRIELDRLIDFYTNPARHFLKNTLGAAMPREDAVLEDLEPMTPDHLESYLIMDGILDDLAAGVHRDEILERMSAEGVLPHGRLARVWFTRMAQEAEVMMRRLEAVCSGRERRRARLEVQVGGCTIEGDVDVWGGDVVAVCRPANVRPGDYMKVWLWLLVLRASGAAPARGFHLGRDKEAEFMAPDCWEPELSGLVEVYREGLSRPVHLFPRSSYAYAGAMAKGWGEARAMAEARKKWRNEWGQGNESEDDSVELLFHGTDPLDDEFRRLSQKVFGPLRACMKERRA
jgi:exodeoxyribonuclease V gamma subunit